MAASTRSPDFHKAVTGHFALSGRPSQVNDLGSRSLAATGMYRPELFLLIRRPRRNGYNLRNQTGMEAGI
jgi:hypothetical protein